MDMLSSSDEFPMAKYDLCSWSRKPVGIYLPAWNQLWQLPNAQRLGRSDILLHELAHAFTAGGLSPPRFGPFMNEMAQKYIFPVSATFSDLMETTCLLYQAAVKPRNAFVKKILSVADSTPRRLAYKLMQVADALVSKASPHLPRSTARQIARAALSMFLCRLMPLTQTSSEEVVEITSTLNIKSGWKDDVGLLFYMTFSLKEIFDKKPEYRNKFGFFMVDDPHYWMDIILTGIHRFLLNIDADSNRFLAIFPNLVEMIGMGTFRIMPVFQVSDLPGYYLAHVQMANYTKRHAQRFLKKKRFWTSFLKKDNQGSCPVMDAYLQMMTMAPHWLRSTSPSRLDQCIMETFPIVGQAAKQLNRYKGACSLCRNKWGLEKYRFLRKSLYENVAFCRIIFLSLAKSYERWLLNGCVEQVAKELGFPKSVKVLKNFSHL